MALFVSTLSVCVGAGGTTVNIEDAIVEYDSVTTIPIVFNNISDFGAATITVAYDPHFFAIEKISSGDCGSPSHSLDDGDNTVTISSYVVDIPGPTGDLVFAEIEARVLGSTGESQLAVDVDVLVHSDGSLISYNLKNGIFTIASDGAGMAPTTTQTDTASEEEPVTTLSAEVGTEDGSSGIIPDTAHDTTTDTEAAGVLTETIDASSPSPTPAKVPGFNTLTLAIAMASATAVIIHRKKGNW
jgi:hypothetical protein